MKKIKVIKSSGVAEEYSPVKLKRSLERSGLKPPESEEIVSTIESELNKEEESTEHIFKKTRDVVFKKSHLAGFKYSLKGAILEMGPTGFIFERFIAKALSYEGYQTKTDTLFKGFCVDHEVDIHAKSTNQILLGECKFHNVPNIKNDLKTALYVKARMDDLKKNPDNHFDDFFLISNTAFSREAITYAKCSGLKLIGFNYPEDKNLYQMIEENFLYPITSLVRLKRSDINTLLDKGIILCKELCEHPQELHHLGYSYLETENILSVFKHISKENCS